MRKTASKSPAKEKPASPPWRRVFRFHTDEGQLHYRLYRGKVILLKPIGTKYAARAKYLEHKMMHTMFPEHAIKPLGLSSMAGPDGKKVWGMVSVPLKGRSAAFKRFQEGYYERVFGVQGEWDELRPVFRKRTPHKKLIREHLMFSNKVAGEAWTALSKAGFYTNRHPVNIARVGGKPVFIENSMIIDEALKKTIYNMPDGAKKRKMQKLFKEWRSLR